jgi:hypothetical protein
MTNYHNPQMLLKCPPVLQVGNLAYLKDTATPSHLTQKWKGPFKVILTTCMVAKLAGFPFWVTYQSLLTGPTKIKISCLSRIPEDGGTPTETPRA